MLRMLDVGKIFVKYVIRLDKQASIICQSTCVYTAPSNA